MLRQKEQNFFIHLYSPNEFVITNQIPDLFPNKNHQNNRQQLGSLQNSSLKIPSIMKPFFLIKTYRTLIGFLIRVDLIYECLFSLLLTLTGI